MSSIRSMLRKHLHFLVIASVLLVLMTWPTIVYVFDTETFWLPTDGRDVWIKYWDAWHARSILAGEADIYFTNVLFYPHGMSLAYHPSNVFHVSLFAIFQSIMGSSNAFNLVYLMIILATTLSAYVFLSYLFEQRWLAIFGAVIFGFSQHIVGHPNHPDVNFLITIPLTLYALQRGIEEKKMIWYLASGVMLGITAFIGMYIFVCLLLTLGFFTIFFTHRAWLKPRFLIGMALLLSVAAAISLARVYPMIRDTSKFDDALEKNLGQEYGKDLLSYFVSGGHPLLSPVFVEVFDLKIFDDLSIREQHKTSYLGYLPMLLIVLGFCSAKHRRKMYPWLLLLLPFLILRLGSTLLINGVEYPDIVLPLHFLKAALPFIFQPFYATDHFQMGILLPFSILSCFGLQVLLKNLPNKYRSLAILSAVCLIAFEYYQVPLRQVIPDRQLEFNNWLRSEPNQEDIKLINLPMGRSSSKIYGFYQSLNGYPHAEGLAYRMPAKSYNYILQNHLLVTWHRRGNTYCSSDAFDRYLSAVDQLLNDGYTHVVLHHGERSVEEIKNSFLEIAPAYEDEYVSIYRLPTLREDCLERVEGYQNQLPILKEFLQAPINRPRSEISLIALYPSEVYSRDALHPYDIALADWRDLSHVVHASGSAALVINADEPYSALGDIVAENNLFWLIYSPQESDPNSQSQFATWLNQNLSLCQQIHRGEGLIVDYYIDRAYSCELVLTDDPLELRYDNGITLANLLAGFDGEQFSVDSWWQRGAINGHAYTIQVFNEHGEKKLQVDRVIDSRPLSRAQFDTSNLEPGDYFAKLIVYETESGASQSGVIQSAQQAFNRELEIARFRVET